MREEKIVVAHRSFWIVGIVALIWNVMGCLNFVIQLNPDAISAYRESERAIIEGRPLWATGAFAIAVFGGAIGSVLLLLRKASSFFWFVASGMGVILTMFYTLGVDVAFGFGEILGIVLMPLVVALVLIWYSKLVKKKGWIG